MASSMMVSSAAVASTLAINRAGPAQASVVAPFTGLKVLPTIRKTNSDLSHLASNGGRVQCMKVWPPKGLLKFETLSYLQPLSRQQLAKQVEYLIKMGWVPCLEFDEVGFVRREYNASPGYYDGRYWTMWKLPMFGCTDASQVLTELEEAKKEYPNSFIRILGFDNLRQVQCCMFIAYQP
ncbi:ribulose bisphosphate carboxylase small subunit, chloroplastic 5-like [Tasmannia lanceolata]|uniref:ribulose bisphosphate carboxylase small subunit, chloroplastic 5-like n=1 Tax=Tasmannia lanceolata TaxID=3420 RepID=UPI00406331E9